MQDNPHIQGLQEFVIVNVTGICFPPPSYRSRNSLHSKMAPSDLAFSQRDLLKDVGGGPPTR